jgi:fucose permease
VLGSATVSAPASLKHRSALLLALAYLGFISLGLPDGVLGLVWPSVQELFGLASAALGAPLAVGAVTYFLSGLLAGTVTRALGIGGVLALSTALVALGIGTYASAPSFSIFLLGSAIIGFGSGGVDTGLNSYASRHFGARHMTWLHAAYSLGAACGPAIVTTLFAYGASFRVAYAVIAALLAVLATAFAFTRRRWNDRKPEPAAATAEPERLRGGTWDALSNGRVQLQALLFFVYTGIEVGAGQWSYTLLTRARGVDARTAGIYVTAYWTSLLVGRVLSGFIVERIGTVALVRLGAACAALGGALFATWTLPPLISALGLALLGLALAPIFPGLMSETPRRVGADVSPYAIGFQVSAGTAGVAVLPNLAGLGGETYGLPVTGAFIAAFAVVFWFLHELLVRVADRSPGAP